MWKIVRTSFAKTFQQLDQALRELVDLDFVGQGGSSTRSILLSVERQAGIKDPRIHNPTLPPNAAKRLWKVFWELNKARQGTGYGPAPIPNTELQSWCQMMGVSLSRWELQAFRMLDVSYLQEMSAKLEQEK